MNPQVSANDSNQSQITHYQTRPISPTRLPSTPTVNTITPTYYPVTPTIVSSNIDTQNEVFQNPQSYVSLSPLTINEYRNKNRYN